MVEKLDQYQANIPAAVSAQELSLIDNLIVGTPVDDILSTTALNDLVIALAGNDRIIGSTGNDILLGDTGTDTVDYSQLGQVVTLEAAGFVKKGKAGTDRLFGIETIIGAKGKANIIDGSTSTSTTTSLDVNLSTNSLVVNGVPGIGTLKFKVQNFANVTGTSQADQIIGSQGNNLLTGKEGNDQIFGLNGNDTINGDGGNDVIGGGSKSTIVGSASDGNDSLNGGSGNDTLIGGTGNDILDGSTDFDTADYSNLGNAIALQAVGVVNKGASGIDQILNIESIIGATGKANTIDGSTGTSTTTSLDVNLSANSLVVNGIPGLGAVKFQVQNFVNVTGTSQADQILGDGGSNLLIGKDGNDQIFGLNGDDTINGDGGNDVIAGGSKSGINLFARSDGNDSLNGGTGNDTLIGDTGNDILDGGTDFDIADYSNSRNAITLEAVGVVNKNGAGIDQIRNIESIIGTTNQANAIDGSTGTSTTTSLDVNLSANRLVVNGIPGVGAVKFQVQNFVNVTGTNQNDTIVGNSKANVLTGNKGNDTISGLGGQDTLIGVAPGSVNPGIKEIDILTGGADADKFVIGDAKNSYYVGGGGFFGLNDFAFAQDFQTGQDKIQLKKLENYIFGRNYIAIRPLFDSATGEIAIGSDFKDSQVTATVDQIVKNNGVYDASKTNIAQDSLSSSLIFPGFDIVAIVGNSYSVNDIQFV
ncbi:calcium-binding protein [Calothrix sp. FACHB-1219]|uniref:calcium-binding protein n=1 Tax=unclassified Calothrix TaxID=2619626 RepID=UPI0016858135|nr:MULTISPECIES: calcium-binding protein [unclassified Calothrix]MBD2206583.1 calcium-binding protein [Calothrix sp. FACHB-168]MBD2221378.1 calcium-binding protein [Calothrix sp. FACHB-1219]